ncbi:hypothetical protein N7527_000774 [Penicillium freii]|nr:hypothetical protein N7527_000774 [Penicillium freii]
MSSDSFRLDSFRPWNPFQDKAQPLRDSLDICHYPSPISITASPPSNPSNSASTNPNFHFHKPERHPLPPRPPAEACLNYSLSQEINTRHQPAVQYQTLCVNPGVEAFGFDDILQLQDLPGSGDGDHRSGLGLVLRWSRATTNCGWRFSQTPFSEDCVHWLIILL